MSKTPIGTKAPHRVSAFESRTGSGMFQHALPPITGDAAIIQQALLSRREPVRRGWLARLFRR